MSTRASEMLGDGDYTGTDAVHEWYLRCGFETRKEAATALELPLRTFYRYLAYGLPPNVPGKFVAHRMAEIEQTRKRRRR